MIVDLNVLYDKLPWEAFTFQNKYIPKILTTYFKLKGFRVQDDFLAFGYDYMFHYEFHCPSFTFEAFPNPDLKPYPAKDRPLIYFFRYLNYPEIDDTYTNLTSFKTTGSTLGLIEKVLKTIDKKLLPIIQEGGEELKRIELDSTNKFLSQIGTYNPKTIVSDIEKEKDKNLSKSFFPKYLNPEYSSARDIKKQLEQLLLE